MPALFFRLAIDAVRVDEAAFVLEHQSRQFKRDSIVFPLVPKVLRFVPLVTHRVYTYCTISRVWLRPTSFAFAHKNRGQRFKLEVGDRILGQMTKLPELNKLACRDCPPELCPDTVHA